MTGHVDQAREAIRRCRELRDAGKVEAVLRSEFVSRLRLIFPSKENESWINHYSSGTEALTQIAKSAGKTAARFIDNLVGSTTIEYEGDLRIASKRDEGYRQVKEHVSGLVRNGVPLSQIRGVLSDTVDWHAYDVGVDSAIKSGDCKPEDIQLVEVDSLTLATDDDASAHRLISFVLKHLAREQSRPLRAEFLTQDLGLDSPPYLRSGKQLLSLVVEGRSKDSSIALATDLWAHFVDFLEGDTSEFRANAYADEIYLCVIARLLSANVLAGKALSSSDVELSEILSGEYFRARYRLENMVERDYFGWLTVSEHISKLLPIAREIQQDLLAYDFGNRGEEDLFGRLMAQLARRSQRKLLGQEWTPSWLGHLLAERCLDGLPTGQPPRVVDMCCGSGSILAEVLKSAMSRYGLSTIQALHDVATGFDIDPLAVSLAKTTWVVTLADQIKSATAPVVIPIYHADSLFAVTPVSSYLPFMGETKDIEIQLDDTTIALPNELVRPESRELFDQIVSWVYDEALLAKAKGSTADQGAGDATTFVEGASSGIGLHLSAALKTSLVKAVGELRKKMSELALANRNGIWAFILRNTYRPALLTGQFNGLVSNPPWLAMSGLADNPYKEVLTERARIYGIRPPGPSFLHLELGTAHLLHAVDRYLSQDASIACLVPGTVLNGHHHEPLRQRAFLNSARPVALEIGEVWQVVHGTFKYPGAAIIGHKRGSPNGLASKPISGFVAVPGSLEAADFSVRQLGPKRTAWVLEKAGMPATLGGMDGVPQQGADLMPRTAVCVEIVTPTGSEYRVETPAAGSPWAFAVKAAKELKDAKFPGFVSPRFLCRMAQSENLLPFVFGSHTVPVALPAIRGTNGAWKVYDDAEIGRMGLTQTARRFSAINAKLKDVGKGKSLQERVDERSKLSKQVLGGSGYLLLAGAGGKYICAACIPVVEAQDLVIDQTLYWKTVPTLSEARFFVGMLNSNALTQAILPFNPKGDFGERHIHALPYRLMPQFSADNEDHIRISELVAEIEVATMALVSGDAYLNDPAKQLPVRRRRVREKLASHPAIIELDTISALLLGTSIADEPESQN